jgi:hypothetical protein
LLPSELLQHCSKNPHLESAEQILTCHRSYVPGDEIILIGFSRGAFTVRSVAAMINDIGLLTRAGMSEFYPMYALTPRPPHHLTSSNPETKSTNSGINSFKDQENFMNERYRDIFPNLPFPNKPRGANAAREYKRRLLEVSDPALSGCQILIGVE